MWTEYVVNNIRSIRLQLNKNYIDMQCVDICSLQLPTNPTPTELCMVTPKYNTVHVYKIRQPTTITSLRCCVLSSLRSIRLQQNMNCLNMHYVDIVCSEDPTNRLLPLLDGLWLYFICSLQLPTNPTPSELGMVCDAYTIQLPIDPTPTEVCMVTPKYKTCTVEALHVYKIRQPTTILQF